MDPGQVDGDMLVGLREQELRFFAKWSLISGIGAFGILILSIAPQIIIELVTGGEPSRLWSISFFLQRITVVFTLGSSIIAIVFAVLGKRRLTPDSEKGVRNKLNAGLILGVVYLSLILITIFLSSIFYFRNISWFD